MIGKRGELVQKYSIREAVKVDLIARSANSESWLVNGEKSGVAV
jgi:hypothetical protein